MGTNNDTANNARTANQPNTSNQKSTANQKSTGNTISTANQKAAANQVALLVPDMPPMEEIVPFLVEIDNNKWYSNFGPLCLAFEKLLKHHFFSELPPDSKRMVSCSNGTAAIELALIALNLPAGARVLLPAFTFPATATAVIRVGLTPVFADVDEKSWQLTPDIARHLLVSSRADVILPVAALGMPHHALAWQKFSRDTGIPVVIDAAAALGAQDTAPGITVCYSLHATKSFGVGEGGVIVAADDAMGERIRQMANFGFSAGVIVHAGGNYKLSEYHAAVGLAQFKRLPLLQKRRELLRKGYQEYSDALLPHFEFQSLPDNYWGEAPVVPLRDSRFYGAAAICLKRNAAIDVESLVQHLAERGVQTRRWYCPSLQYHPAFSHVETFGLQGDHFMAVTEFLQTHVVGIPYHNALRRHDIRHVISSVLASVENKCISIDAV